MQDIIKDSILEGFQAQMSTDGLKTFYDKLKAYQKDGAVLTKEQIAELNEEYATFLSTYKGKLSALEEATGISFSELVNAETAAIDEGLRILQDGISSLIDSGKISAEDFGKNFEEVIKKAVLEGLKAEIFVDGLKSLNEKIREFQKQGTPFTKEQIEELRADYLSFTEDVQARLAALTEATGISFSEIVEQQVQAVDDGLKTLQDGMFALFQNGTISAQDFGDQFHDIIRNAILTGFQTRVFANGLKVFYDNLQALQASNGSLTPAEIAELRQQYDAFVNDAKAKYEELERITGISLSKPVAQVIETAKETIDTEFESLVDTIAGVFGTMTGAGEEFGAKFEDIMKKAVLNSFKTQYLANALKGFYDQLNGYTANGATLSQVQIASLKEQYDAIIKGGQERIKEIEKATGIDFQGELSADPGLKGKLQRELTETTASEFLGVGHASFEQHKIIALTSVQLLSIAKENYNTAKAIEANTLRTANNTQVLHEMAKDIKRMSGGKLTPDKYDLGL